MSVAVELSALAEHLEAFGRIAYLVSVGPEGRPHVVSVEPGLSEGHLLVGAGRTTLRNVGGRPEVTLLWPAAPGGAYGLIVDGVAEARPPDEPTTLAVRPTAAVLHRTPAADPSEPSCVNVLAGP